MAEILYGKTVAAAMRAELEERIKNLAGQGIYCGLAIVLVDGDPASRVYTNSLVKLAAAIGIKPVVRELAADVTEQELLNVIAELNNDESIYGILPMMPLPAHLNADKIAEQVAAVKDVDSVNPLNIGLVAAGKSKWAPCTPRAVMAILDHYGVGLSSAQAVIVGRSNVVGKPLMNLLLARDATVTVCHSRTKDLAAVVRQADIVIAAVGRPGLITGEMLKPGAVVVDVGINEVDGKIVGDVEQASAEKTAGAITPVPGGVGTVVNYMVMDALLKIFS